VKPERSDDSDRECKMCDGAFNHMTKGKKHWLRDCPLLSLSAKKKAELFLKILSSDKEADGEQDEGKTESAKGAVRFRKEAEYDSDDSEEFMRHSIIMGTSGR
jgi:hypothetical protein